MSVAMLRPLTVASGLEDGLDMVDNGRGVAVPQLFQRLPLGSLFYSSFEKEYNTDPGTEFARQNYWVPLTFVTVYGLAIFLGSRFMAKREPADLRGPLAYWNLLLATFSFCGAMRTVPDLLYRLLTQPLFDTVCTAPDLSWGMGATGFWVQLFIFSKIPELVDTFFIVARKKRLMFLHWYHHVTVLLYCWHSYATEAPQALYFVAMNYSVHAIMYGYYYLMAVKQKPNWLQPGLITGAQISQMVVGVAVQAFGMIQYYSGSTTCPLNASNLFWGGVMYGSYLFLFCQFAVDRYILAPRRKALAAKAKAL